MIDGKPLKKKKKKIKGVCTPDTLDFIIFLLHFIQIVSTAILFGEASLCTKRNFLFRGKNGQMSFPSQWERISPALTTRA